MSVYGTQFKNEGELEKVLIGNHYEAIILIEDFTKAQRSKVNFIKQKSDNISYFPDRS